MKINKIRYFILPAIGFLLLLSLPGISQQVSLVSNQGHTGGSFNTQFSKNGEFLLSCSKNEWILWESRSGKVLYRYVAAGKLQCVNFSTNDNFIAAADKLPDGHIHIKLWQMGALNMVSDLNRDSLKAPTSVSGDIISVFFQEDKQILLWSDNHTISVYSKPTGHYHAYEDLKGRFNYFQKIIFSAGKIFACSIDYNNGNSVSSIYYAPLTEEMTFEEITYHGSVSELYYIEKNNCLYYTTQDGFLIRHHFPDHQEDKIALPGVGQYIHSLYQTNNKNQLLVTFYGHLMSIDLVTNEVRQINPSGTWVPSSILLNPVNETECIVPTNTTFDAYQHVGDEWKHTFSYGNYKIEGDGQMSYLGSNLLFIHTLYVSETLGFFINLNDFSFSVCDDPASQNTMLNVQPLSREKREMICTYKMEGASLDSHYFLKEFSSEGLLRDSIDVNKLIPSLGPRNWVTFYITPDQKGVVVSDTAQKSLVYINRGTKKVEKTVAIPSPVKNGHIPFKHDMIFGPAAGQVIYMGNRIIWFDVNKQRTIKAIDSTESYSSYKFIRLDHDSTNLIYRDFATVRFNFQTGKKDTIASLAKATILRPILSGQLKLWAVGFENGHIELRDNSLQRILYSTSVHLGSVNDICYDQKTGRLFSIGEDNHICITDARDLKLLLTVLIQHDKNEYSFLAYSPANEFYYPAFSTDIIHLSDNQHSYDFNSLDAFRNRPDKIAGVISSDSLFVKQLRLSYQIRKQKLHIPDKEPDIRLLPKFQLSGRGDIAAYTSSGIQVLHVQIVPQKTAVTKLHVLANGIPVYGTKGLEVRPNQDKLDISVDLARGMNYLQVFVEDAAGNYSLRENVDINYKPLQRKKSKIIYIGLGVSAYKEKAMYLPYSVKDVSDVDSVISGLSFKKVASSLFLDTGFNQHSLQSIQKTLESADVEDQVIVFYSGHGTRAADHEFLFCPSETNAINAELTGIRLSALLACFDHCKARQRVLFIDACESGDFAAAGPQTRKEPSITELTRKNRDKEKERNQTGLLDFYNAYFSDVANQYGVQILASSYGTDDAFQDNAHPNSIFTGCVLKALDEFKTEVSAHMLKSYYLMDLRKYLKTEVVKASSGRQTPATVSINSKYDWEITDWVN